MSHKSSNSIKKALVLNTEATLNERLRALRQLRSSRRFLERLLTDSSLPAKLHAEASRILLAQFADKPKHPARSSEPPNPAPTSEIQEEARESKTSDGLTVMDAELWDLLCLGNPDASIPGCVRGPDPETPTLPFPSTPQANGHIWRDARGEENE